MRRNNWKQTHGAHVASRCAICACPLCCSAAPACRAGKAGDRRQSACLAERRIRRARACGCGAPVRAGAGPCAYADDGGSPPGVGSALRRPDGFPRRAHQRPAGRTPAVGDRMAARRIPDAGERLPDARAAAVVERISRLRPGPAEAGSKKGARSVPSRRSTSASTTTASPRKTWILREAAARLRELRQQQLQPELQQQPRAQQPQQPGDRGHRARAAPARGTARRRGCSKTMR